MQACSTSSNGPGITSGYPVTRSQCTETREGASSIERERLIYPFLLLCLFASAVEISSTGLP